MSAASETGEKAPSALEPADQVEAQRIAFAESLKHVYLSYEPTHQPLVLVNKTNPTDVISNYPQIVMDLSFDFEKEIMDKLIDINEIFSLLAQTRKLRVTPMARRGGRSDHVKWTAKQRCDVLVRNTEEIIKKARKAINMKIRANRHMRRAEDASSATAPSGFDADEETEDTTPTKNQKRKQRRKKAARLSAEKKKRARDDKEYADMPELGSDRSDEEHAEMMTNRTDAQPCKVSGELRAPTAKKTKREKK